MGDEKDEKRAQVLDLHREGLSFREIERQTGVSHKTAQRWVAGSDGDSPRISATGKQWGVELNPWIRLIHQAAAEQVQELRGISLADFIYQCCIFTRDALNLKPPGWAMEVRPMLNLTPDPGWNSPEVDRAAQLLQEATDGDEPDRDGVPEDPVADAGDSPGDGEHPLPAGTGQGGGVPQSG